MALNLNALSIQCHIFSRPPVGQIRSKVRMASTSPTNSMVLDNLKAPPTPEVIHSMPPEKVEIFKSLDDWARNNILVHLKSVEESWQPQNYLPDPVSEGFEEQVVELRERAKEIPDDYFVVLVGDMITEEALPTYMSYINNLDGTKDESGADPTAWATWTRGWTAEENRHGDLMNKYLYLSGRVDMKQIEKTIQYLLGAGMDIKTENNPYNAFIFASFQEKATFISHANTAKLAQHYGDKNLAQICGTIASDEKRHAAAYTKMVQKLAEIDSDTTVIAFANMMRKKIQMPGHSMYDGSDNLLFKHFASVSQKIGVYSAEDYCDILEFLVKKWNIEKLTGLSDEGKKSQEFVCDLATKIRRIDKIKGKGKEKKALEPVSFSWIFNRELMI